MKGTILGYVEKKGSGAISGDDGARYKFATTDFMGEGSPVVNSVVDFEVVDGEAKDIFVVQKARSQGADIKGIQSKATNAIGDVSSNAEIVSSGFSSAPVAVVALLIYGVGIFVPYISLFYDNQLFGVELILFDTTYGKVALALVALLLVIIMTDVIKKKKLIKECIAGVLLCLPLLDVYLEWSSFSASFSPLLGSSVNAGDRLDVILSSMRAGSYMMGLSALVLLFSPIKQKGEEK